MGTTRVHLKAMSAFSQIIGSDKVGQQPLVQSVLKGSKKLKPQGTKRRRLWRLPYSTGIFVGISVNKKLLEFASELFLTG